MMNVNSLRLSPEPRVVTLGVKFCRLKDVDCFAFLIEARFEFRRRLQTPDWSASQDPPVMKPSPASAPHIEIMASQLYYPIQHTCSFLKATLLGGLVAFTFSDQV